MDIYSLLNHEIDPFPQKVEVSFSRKIPYFHIIGLASKEVSEAKERIQAAFENLNLKLPRKKITINLTPAHIQKHGTGHDLAMALKILVKQHTLKNGYRIMAWGELGLDGSLRNAEHLFRAIYCACTHRMRAILLPSDCLEQTKEIYSHLRTIKLFPAPLPVPFCAKNLKDAWDLLKKIPIEDISFSPSATFKKKNSRSNEPSLLKISPQLERVLCLVAAGSHHLLLLGSKGMGKSKAAEWLKHLFPFPRHHFLMTHILLSDLKKKNHHFEWEQGIFRRVSSHAKPASLLGGIKQGQVMPGECSLAHGGILFADEFPEWSRDARECLREPLEDEKIHLLRSFQSTSLPASFTFIGTGNLCPCGDWEPQKLCECSEQQKKTYQKRLSQAFLDRMDITWVLSSRPSLKDLSPKESQPFHLKMLKQKIQKAQEKSLKKFGSPAGKVPAYLIEKTLQKDLFSKKWFEEQTDTSLRARHKIYRLAWTLAFWENCKTPTVEHLNEASLLHYSKWN